MLINLTKMHGIGNDFIMMDDRSSKIKSEISYDILAKKLCDRHYGIGGDGLIIACSSIKNDIGFKIFNADGSEAEMCGNGMRCFGKYLYERAIHMQTIIDVETKAGTIVPLLDINEEGIVTSVKVDMGEPRLEACEIPCSIKKDGRIVSEKIEVLDKSFEITCVSMGNPHTVIFTDTDIDDDFFFKYGPKIENHDFFPENTNVHFVKIISRDEISMRVWERGAGETLACGTGACACVVAAILGDKTSRNVLVRLKGGELNIQWNETNNRLYKTGPAKIVFDTKIDIERIKNDL